MHKLTMIVAALMALSFAGNALAVEMSAGRQRQAECSAEWKAKKAEPGYVAPVKGQGRAAWNAFRSECTVRKGGKSKSQIVTKPQANSGLIVLAGKRSGKRHG